MFKPIKMQKIRMIGTKSTVQHLIKMLHEMGVMEIRTVEQPGLDVGRPLSVHDEISSELLKIRGILANIKKIPHIQPKVMEWRMALEESKNIVIYDEVKAFYEERAKVEGEISELRKKLETVEKLNRFGAIDFSRLKTRTLDYIVGSIKVEKIAKLQKELNEYVKDYEMTVVEGKNEYYALISYPKDIYMESIVDKYGFRFFEIPEGMTTPSDTANRLNKEIEARSSRLIELDRVLLSFSEKYYEKLVSIEKALVLGADRSEIASRFGFSKMTYVVEGWIRAIDYPKLEQKIADNFGNSVILEKAEREYHEEVPVELDNPKPMKQFQFLVEFFSLPKSDEVDPSFLLLFTLPLLYGMMLGDVVYGLLSLAISLWLMKKFQKGIMNNVAKIWAFSAIPAIFFGVIFDEWLGMSHYHLIEVLSQWGIVNLQTLHIAGPLYHGLERVENVPLLIGISSLVGVFYLALGFIMGAVNAWEHDKKHAVAKIAWIGMLLGGVVFLSSSMFKLLPESTGNVGTVIGGISLLLMLATEGIMGIFEITGLIGNVLSFARIAAVGVSGVIIAELLNEMMIPLPSQGLMALVMLPLFIILHLLNTGLAMFEGLIQGGRLNLVEFYSKFFHGGGKQFKPFAHYFYSKNNER